MEYDNDNDMVEIIQPTKKTKGKQNDIIDELIWTKETMIRAKQIQNGAEKNAKRTVIVMLNVMTIVPVESNAQTREFRIRGGSQLRKR